MGMKVRRQSAGFQNHKLRPRYSGRRLPHSAGSLERRRRRTAVTSSLTSKIATGVRAHQGKYEPAGRSRKIEPNSRSLCTRTENEIGGKRWQRRNPPSVAPQLFQLRSQSRHVAGADKDLSELQERKGI
jgi:hypothetical protein